MRVEHRLRVAENSVLRKVFGPKSDEVTGEFRRLHNYVLHDLHSPDIQVIKSRKIRSVGHVGTCGRGEVNIGFWWGNLRNIPGGRPRHRWKDNIQTYLQEVGWGHGLD